MLGRVRIDHAVEAWNVDGSSDAQAASGSWLGSVEEATGRRRGRCSFEGCHARAEVGGHVWVRGNGCFIAPICRKCNCHTNLRRVQGAGARLRVNIEVVKTQVTTGMRNAERRGVAGGGRRCASCKSDISDRPASHASCYLCWQGGSTNQLARYAASGRSCVKTNRIRKDGRSGGRRRCASCKADISDRPASHASCYRCWQVSQ